MKGTFADTPEGQHIRSLVVGGHLGRVSVEFLRRKNPETGLLEHELVGGALVNMPANPEARVLAAKGAKLNFDQFKAAVLALETKAAEGPVAETARLQAIHNASCHLGAEYVQPMPEADDSGADDGANKAAALSLKLKMLRM
ncbi:Uncharacterised protein [Mycobacteroides abscessus subsp. abscessus]|nr:Uncharacterised protein [Mycobacteroides abscessus subsp. abscessus]